MGAQVYWDKDGYRNDKRLNPTFTVKGIYIKCLFPKGLMQKYPMKLIIKPGHNNTVKRIIYWFMICILPNISGANWRIIPCTRDEDIYI